MTEDRHVAEQLLHLDEVAEFLAVSRRSVHRLVQRGQLRCVRVGPSSPRVRVGDLIAFVESQSTQPPPT